MIHRRRLLTAHAPIPELVPFLDFLARLVAADVIREIKQHEAKSSPAGTTN